jgi:endonuclease/exonuclease/phosphatase family metal-dependent hydrolase
VRVLTFNIRYNNPLDGANGWPHRQEAVAKLIKERADVAGLQEVKRSNERGWWNNFPSLDSSAWGGR